jgi:hypothetical protein
VLERCPHCGHRGADVLRSERRPGACVLHLSCRTCSGDWLSTEDVDEKVFERWMSELKKESDT